MKRRTLFPITVILAMLVALPIATARSENDRGLSDIDISNAIRSELILDEAVPSHRIDVDTAQGIVTLSGSVNSVLAKDRAIKQAMAIKGVRSVVDKMEVKPVWRPDRQIRQDVIAALASDPAADGYEVDVAVRGGVVTLSGTVDSWAEQELSVDVAKGVRGVREVQPNIRISSLESRSDHEIKQDIVRRLELDVYVDDGLIETQVEDGKVTLTGTVGSAAERMRAETDAWVNGVRSVDSSGVEVEWWARDEMRRTDRFTGRSNEELEQAVKDAFLYDPRVNSFEITVRADDGAVTLSGVVDNLQAKRSAKEDAKNTVGVWRVKNLIAVRTNDIYPDAEIASEVREAIDRDPYVNSSDITVTALNGRVYLGGSVGSFFDREWAEHIASGVQGVVEVDNSLIVDSSYVSDRSDWEIRRDIEDELFWSPFVDSDEVTVTVEDGVATLSGQVDTWSEFTAASENAREGGARRVDNDLEVRYGPTILGGAS